MLARSLAPLALALTALASAPPHAPAGEPAPGPAPEASKAAPRPVVQLAVLLDTSGSMQGLIDQARARIWDVVNDLSLARKNGQRPVLQVALYQYGSDQLPSSEGFLRCVQPLTTDLDLISERLFALTIDGQAEYCGMAIDSALKQLAWDATPATAPLAELPLRVIVIAGNEEFTQGPVDYHPVVKTAKSRGVFINTVYCGRYQEGEKSGWLNAAYLNGGSYNAIDHSTPVAETATPFDDDILRLNAELNATYLAYGSRGQEYQARQTAQDTANTAHSKSGGVARAVSKAGATYTNTAWDVVDYVDSGKDIGSIPTADLPEHLKPMTVEERRAYVAKLKAQREDLRRRINELNARRAEAIRAASTRPRDTLDSAIIKAIREQAAKVGFAFSKD